MLVAKRKKLVKELESFIELEAWVDDLVCREDLCAEVMQRGTAK